jgi:PEP-CTERM motif
MRGRLGTLRTANASIRATALAALLAASTFARADTFVLNYEAPGLQNTTAKFSVMGVETFDEQPVGINPTGFTTDFGTGGAITGVYSGPEGVDIKAATDDGGAGGTGNYIVAYGAQPYTLTLSSNPTLDPEGINYFGFWLSALDDGNIVTFYNNGVELDQVTPGDVSAITELNPAYYGNPNPAFLGQNASQPYVFINFYDTNGTFNQITFTEDPAVGGYESDNHTVGFYTEIGGVGGVPEPSTWAMLMAGFGLVALWRRRRTLAAA